MLDNGRGDLGRRVTGFGIKHRNDLAEQAPQVVVVCLHGRNIEGFTVAAVVNIGEPRGQWGRHGRRRGGQQIDGDLVVPLQKWQHLSPGALEHLQIPHQPGQNPGGVLGGQLRGDDLLDDLDVIHRGTSRPLDISIGLAQLGGLHVELVEQHNPGPSVYRDVYDGGFHHICCPVPDIDAACDCYHSAGFQTTMSLQFGDTPVVYIDTRTSIGCMTELIRDDPAVLDLYATVADSAAGGGDPTPFVS